MARPDWPAPTMTVVTLRNEARRSSSGREGQLTSTVTLVGLVTMSYTADRFCDCATSAFFSSVGGVSVDRIAHLDPAEPVAHVGVRAEDASDVHVALQGGAAPNAAGCPGSGPPPPPRR